jgi:alkylation response protein AidB-like acyl-CoA dehydrogenase
MIYNAPIREMLFLITEWLGLDRITSLPGNEDVDAELIEAILEEAGKFASTELLPINREGDEYGARFKDGNVETPPGFKQAYTQFIENGWTGIDAKPEHGGQGLPKLLQNLIDEMIGATNVSFKLYTELSRGAYHLLDHAASDEIREKYLPKMVEGVWSGTMCLTEPHCGTDLGLLSSKAVPAGDGDLTENILHLVIARIEGAPAGTRGISLFLVPKFLVNDDGSIGDRNTVQTTSIEHKMGIRASATCTLNFDGATGYLIGEENRGLAAMFQMMNTERMTVGLQGLGMSEIAYQNALAYAQERLQSKAPAPRPESSKAADPIIYQPEMQRQLLTIRSQVEGARALSVYTGLHVDIMERSPDAAAAAAAESTVALLTPVIKAHFSDLGMSSTLSAQQIFGGHGYVREHGMEQLVRDCRIAPIYEGTNEIQALDLAARKVTGRMSAFANQFLAEWQQLVTEQCGQDKVAAIAAPAAAAMQRLVDATGWLQGKAESDDAAVRGAACQYLRLFALTISACLWVQIIASISGKVGTFYDVKHKLARFYMQQVLPETAALLETIVNGDSVLADFEIADFAV